MRHKTGIAEPSDRLSSSSAPQRFAERIGRFHLVLAVLLQGILLVLMVHRGLFSWEHRIIGLEGDPSIYIWFLSWWGNAILHGWPLATTHLITYPFGNNILWDTSVPLVFIPLSLLVNFHTLTLPVAYNLATYGGWWFSGAAAYWSFVAITDRRWPSFVGSVMMLCSAYYTNQALGHTDLMWVGFSFLLFTALVRFQRAQISVSAFLWRVALWAVCLWLTNQEYFVTTQIMVGIGVLFLLHDVVMKRRDGQSVRRIIVWYLAGLALTAAVLAPLILWQLTTPNQPFHPFSYINVYQINLANLVVPVHTAIQTGAARLTGNIMEQDGYLGTIAIAGLLTFSWIVWRRTAGRYRLAIYWTLVLLLLAMGDFLLVDLRRQTGIPLPGIVLSLVPVLKDIIFDRFMWGVFWGVGLLVSLYAAELSRRSERFWITLWAALVVVTWWPGGYPSYALSPNAWITRAVQSGRLARGRVLLVFPYDILFNPNNNIMYTQVANHFQYRMAEGYLSPNDAMIKHYNALVSFWATVQLYGPHSLEANYYRTQVGRLGAAFDDFLKRTHPEIVALTSMAHERYMQQWLQQYLGPPQGRSGSTYWWVHPRVRSRFLYPPT